MGSTGDGAWAVVRGVRGTRVALAVLVAGVAAALTACASDGGRADGRLSVVASTNVWGSVVQAVGGGAVDVTSVIHDPSQDPHSYEANAQVKLALSRADLVVENGGGYDDFVGQLSQSLDPRPRTLDAVTISGFAATQGDQLNEHVWYDLPTVQKVADAVAGALAATRPAQAATFRANAAAFDARLDALIATEAQVEAQVAGRGVAITEPVPLYLLDALGLVDRTPPAFSEAVEEGTDVSPQVLDETLALFGEHRVVALVYNAQTTGPETTRVLDAAAAAHVPQVPVTETLPEGQDYLSWMTDTLARVRAAVTS